MKKITFLLLSFIFYSMSYSQISSYTFSQSNATYTPIAGATLLGAATNDDTNFNALNIGFSFNFGGVNFTQLSVSSNGYLAFGSTVATSYLALSDSGPAASNNVVAGFNDDLQGVASSSLSYVTTGTSPNRVFTLQWVNYRNYTTGTSTDSYNFQIKLYETSNLIDFVYGSMVKDATNKTRQVGLRGSSNAVFNNRSTTTDWSATTAGTINTDSCALTSAIFPASGLTYTFTPPNCAAPSALNVAPLSTSSGTVNWTASASATSGYEYVLSTTNTTPTAAGTPVTGTSVTVNSLMADTTYYFFIRSNCGSGNFSGWVSFSFFTNFCIPTSTSALTYINSFSTTSGSTNITNNTSGYTVGGYQDNFATTGVTSFVGGSFNYSFTLVAGATAGFDAGVAIWVDWNRNFTFELSERVYTSNGYILDGTYTGSIAIPSTATLGDYRMRIRTDYNNINPDPCAVSINRTEAEDYKVTLVTPPTDTMDFNNIQYISDGPTGSNTNFTVSANTLLTAYAEGYEAGVTEAAGVGVGVQAWIGSSTTNTNPNTWPESAWSLATYLDNQGNNDNFSRSFTLPVGTNYVASRWKLNNAVFTYGGYNGTWNGTTNNSIVVTVTPLVNDECTGAQTLTVGGVYADNAVQTTNLSATASSQAAPTSSINCSGYVGGDIWFQSVVPASGNLTIETGLNNANTGIDTLITAYTGSCTNLVQVGCDDDGATETTIGFTKLVLTGLTPNSTIYLRVFEYLNDAVGNFKISAYDASLSTDSFDKSEFNFYPNPVKDVLNISYKNTIDEVQIYNLLGQQVYSNKVNAAESTLNVSQLTLGTYLVKVTSNNETSTFKIIKQ